MKNKTTETTEATGTPQTANLYFDNAATSFPKAPDVAESMQEFIASAAANPGRAGHTMAVNVEKMLDQTRLLLTRFFCPSQDLDPNRLIFSMNCTDALNMAIKGITPAPEADRLPHIITTILEHNSVSRVLEAMKRDGLITISRLDCDDEGFVDPSEFEYAIKENTVLIVMTHASNVLGTIQDVSVIGAIARKYGIYFCLDAAQTAGCVPIDIEEMNIDLLAFPGHKSLLGPTGTGGLYIGPRCPDPSESCVDTMSGYELSTTISCDTPGSEKLDPVRQIRMASYIKMKPWREGGSGGDSTDITQPASYPYYLEGGTPNTVGIAGLNSAMNYFDDHKVQDILDHEQQLVAQLIEGIGELPGCRLLGTADSSKRVGTVSFTMDQYKPGELAAILNDHFDIAVRAGLHCAPYTHRRFGTFPDGAVRVSPGPFHSAQDIHAVIQALSQVSGN